MIVIFFVSCKDNKKRDEVAKIVGEWMGKKILFPEGVPCYVAGKETFPELCDELLRKEFKILMYVDSAGCSDCRLNLVEWKQLIEETDNLFHGKVGFLFFFQSKSVREMTYLFIGKWFSYPVFMDLDGTINRINRFPKQMEYQCFLLDKDNKVLMMGNPVLNANILELYKSKISGGKKIEPEIHTTATANKTVHEYGTIGIGSSNRAGFTITNTGSHPLVIYSVSASCGCTNVEWEKRPIEPGQAVNISVEMTPEETGYFSKTIDVHCNIQETSIRLMVNGNTNE